MLKNQDKPDGGFRAWLVVFASFMISFIQDGILYSFGVFIPTLDNFFNIGKAKTTTILSIMAFMTQATGLLAVFLVKRWGHRATTIFGSVLSTLGFILSTSLVYYGVKNVIPYYILTGGMVGAGFGIMYLPAVTIIDHWFCNNLGLATGIASAGTGVGQFALAPVCELLLAKVGLGWSFVIMGVMAASGFLFGLAYFMPSNEPDSSSVVQSQDSNGKKEEEEQSSSCMNLRNIFQVSLLKNPMFILLVLSNNIFDVGLYTFIGLSVDRAITFGIDSMSASWILSAIGIGGFVGRIVCGKIVDALVTRFGDNHAIFALASVLIMNGISIFISQIATSLPGQLICAAVFGFTDGGNITILVVILKKLFSDLDSALGILRMGSGVASLIGPVFVGIVYDQSKSYEVGFFSIGGAVLVATLMVVLVPSVQKCRDRTEKKTQKQISTFNNNDVNEE